MDPTACLLKLLNALADEDRDDAIESCNDLAGWLASGGFFPKTVEAVEEFLESAGVEEESEDDGDVEEEGDGN